MRVGEVIGGGFRLVRERIGAVCVWGAIFLVMNVAVALAVRPMMAQTFLQRTGPGADPAAAFAAMGPLFGIYLLMLVVMLIVYTAALRAAVRPLEGAYAYLRLGADEFRMLLVALAMGIGFFLLYLVLSIPLIIAVASLMASARDAAIPAIALLGFVMLAVMVYFYVRLSLVFALTVLRRRIAIGEAWRLTKGRFWTLFGAYFVVALIVGATWMGVFAFSAGSTVMAMAQHGLDPAAMQAARMHQMEQQYGAITLVTVLIWLVGATVSTLWITLGAGVTGAAALGLLDDEFADVGAIYE